MCDKLHAVVLKNVPISATNVEVYHSLFLIHGSVTDPCCNGRGGGAVTVNGAVVQDMDNGGDFRHLVALQPGANAILISYCNVEYKLRVDWTKNASRYEVVPLYVVCEGHDGQFQAPIPACGSMEVACQRIDVMMQLVQLVYAEKLNEAEVGRKTFRIGAKCRPYASSLAMERAHVMDELGLWNYFADEIIRGEADQVHYRKYVAFIGCTKYEGITDGDFSYERIRAATKATAAIGGGGLALFGTGCMYTWPDTVDGVVAALQNVQPVDMEHFADDSNYRRTFSGCFATNLGSLCHELGHVFDLGHTEHGIMGRSFDAVDQMFVSRRAGGRLLKRRPSKVSSSSKLTKIKWNGAVLRDYLQEKQSNGIYFSQNCCVILAHHKWLQPTSSWNRDEDIEATDVEDSTVAYCAATKTVTGSCPLRLVELRDQHSEMVNVYWALEREIATTTTARLDCLDKADRVAADEESGGGGGGGVGDGDTEEQQCCQFKLPFSVHLSGKANILFAIDAKGNTLKCSTHPESEL